MRPQNCAMPTVEVRLTTRCRRKYPKEQMKFHIRWTILLSCAFVWSTNILMAEGVPVRHQEGLIHGFLVLRTPEGETLGDGDLTQVARGDQVTAKLVFHFKDGSLREETTVYSQHRTFRLLTDHVTQKGPSFKIPMDVSIDARSSQVTVRYTDEQSKPKVETEHLTLPADLANGLLFTLLKNIRPGVARTEVSLLAATPKPRVVKLAISPLGEEPFSVAGSSRKAMHYVVKVELGGLTGVVAPLLKKQPPDMHVWILEGEAPAFVKSEGPLYVGGPIWRVELASPVWPSANSK
jgi:hypothetical protein